MISGHPWRTLVRTTKPLRVAFSIAALLASGCTALLGDFTVGAGSDAETDASADTMTPQNDGAMPGAEGGMAVDGDPLPDASGDAGVSVNISGHVVDFAFHPIPARKVTILDVNGVRTDVTSDAAGAFAVSGVVPPYDAVVAAPLGAGIPEAFLSVSTRHPRLVGWPDPTDASSPIPTERSAMVNVSVQEPVCGSSFCNIDISPYDCAGSGNSFGGGAAGGYSTAKTYTYAVPVSWTGSSQASCVAFNVLVSDATSTHFWYGQVESNGPVADGSTVTTATTLAPTSIPTVGNVTVTVSESPQTPSAWGTPDFDLFFNYPSPSTNGRSFAYLAQVNGGTSLVSGVPNIIGATLSAQAEIGSNFGSSMPDPNLTQSVAAFADALPLSTTAVPLELEAPLSFTTPTENGSISASTGSVTWKGASPSDVVIAQLLAVGDASESPEVGVWTSGTTIALPRLAKAGVALQPSRQSGTFEGRGKVASLDAMLDEGTLAQPDGSEEVDTQIVFALTP